MTKAQTASLLLQMTMMFGSMIAVVAVLRVMLF